MAVDQFFDVVADWADREAIEVAFIRDEYDGWFARISLRDSRGEFSVAVNALEKKKAESGDDFHGRVLVLVNKEIARHRQARIRRLNKLPAALAA